MKTLALLLALTAFAFTASAADFDALAAFGSAPSDNIEEALKRAQKENKRVLVAVYDPEDDYNNQGLQIKYFTALKETKWRLNENFIIVLLPRTHEDLAQYTVGINTERPHYFLLSPSGIKIKDGSLSANPEDGLRRIKELITEVFGASSASSPMPELDLNASARTPSMPRRDLAADATAAFGSVPGHDLAAALKRAETDGKRVFLGSYDPEDDYNNQGLQIKYFTDLKETKRLLNENFIIVLLPRTHKDLAQYNSDMNTERPHYFLLSPTGIMIKDGRLSANPEDGLRRVKELVAIP